MPVKFWRKFVRFWFFPRISNYYCKAIFWHALILIAIILSFAYSAIVSQTIFGKPVNLTLVITANCANMSNILHQIPMFSARSATALRVSQINFCASNRISTQLLSRAKKGASGKAATKIVMKPNCSTEMKIIVVIKLSNYWVMTSVRVQW